MLFFCRVYETSNKTKLDLIGPQDEVGSGGQGVKALEGVGLQGPRGSRGRPTGSQGAKG